VVELAWGGTIILTESDSNGSKIIPSCYTLLMAAIDCLESQKERQPMTANDSVE
jgi:hypothetical protein